MENNKEVKNTQELKTFKFRDPKTGEIQSIATKDDMAFMDKVTGKIIVPNEDVPLYRHKECYGLSDEDFLFENDPARKYEIKYYERTYFDKYLNETITMKCKARINKESGKIELMGLFADTDELYANRKEYGLNDGDFEFVEK